VHYLKVYTQLIEPLACPSHQVQDQLHRLSRTDRLDRYLSNEVPTV
jgi:hypothetical protein